MSLILNIPATLLSQIRARVVEPLKDAMLLKDYKENDRNFKFHKYKKANGAKTETTFRSYSFKLKGTLKHEMYLKALNPVYIKSFLGKDYSCKILMKPNRAIDLEFESKNKRIIELVIYFKKGNFK